MGAPLASLTFLSQRRQRRAPTLVARCPLPSHLSTCSVSPREAARWNRKHGFRSQTGLAVVLGDFVMSPVTVGSWGSLRLSGQVCAGGKTPPTCRAAVRPLRGALPQGTWHLGMAVRGLESPPLTPVTCGTRVQSVSEMGLSCGDTSYAAHIQSLL